MTARLSLFAAGAVFLAACLPLAAADRSNILFIMSDDHAYQAISAYGSNRNQTPNIDRLAKEGMRFDRAFVTNSICGPSRAVIMTGKYSHLNGFPDNAARAWFNRAQQTAPKLLQAAGYNTAVVGKWHLNSDPAGFDDWHILIGQGPYYNPRMKTPTGFVNHEGYTTDIITDVALDWLKNKRDKTKPFFLMYQHKAPHRNWQPAPRHLDKYKDVKIPEPETLFDDYSGREKPAAENQMSVAKHLTPDDLKLSTPGGLNAEQAALFTKAYQKENDELKAALLTPKQQTQWNYQRFVKDYLRCVDAVDESVGRVLDYLDESGLAQNTVVFYTSDQGWYLGEHGWYDKRWMYEESFRTPLLVRWPGKTKAGSTTSQMVMNLDLAETFLDIAGLKVADDMQGRSIVPILAGEQPADWRKSVYYHYYEFPQPHHVHPHTGVRTERYKLIHFYTIDAWELFDLEKDPHELKSVYRDPTYAGILTDMKAELTRLMAHYKDDGTTVAQFDNPDQPPPMPKAKKAKQAK
ncbi:MAG TPA: sulfatase [Pirellulaceae bacterium]|nr:sulfatase [Pirellulaceae bacterium]